MLNTKKILAAALAATMVFGSSISVFAEDPVTSGSTDGAGLSEGHLEKKVVNVVLPTIASGDTPFSYTMDPERLIRATDGAKYADGTTFPAEATDTGVYFLTAANTYANESSALTVTNKSSCDITLSVKVKASKESNGEPTLFFVAGIDKDGKVKNIKYIKIVKSGGDKSAMIKEMKEHFKTLKFEIK